jgi:N-acetylglutamate synthase-like GNAT family acetyltransferase
MIDSKYQFRRATLDDIGAMTVLWQMMRFPVEDMARRITEFQVATDAEGHIVGAIALQLAEKQGLIHSESFKDFGLADQVRPGLFERVKALASNHGLLRFWTQEQAPFWTQNGLHKPDADEEKKLPQVWRQTGGQWLTVKLRDDAETVMSVDQEFALFMQSEKQRTQNALNQAKLFKSIATLVAVAVMILVLVGMFFLWRNQHLLRR